MAPYLDTGGTRLADGEEVMVEPEAGGEDGSCNKDWERRITGYLC